MSKKRPIIPPAWWEPSIPIPPLDKTAHWEASDFERAIRYARAAYYRDPYFDGAPYTVVLAKYIRYCLDHGKRFPYLAELFTVHFIPYLEAEVCRHLTRSQQRHRETLRRYFFLAEAIAALEDTSPWPRGTPLLWWSNFLGQVDRRTIRNRRGRKIDDKKAPTI
ncbi:hypothetical protein LMG31506_00001 [Cupriavidus yeoncheonensis]|uniref:Uncharacterized protein n=2 Tax=Cupriavidus yeoncheonensis TaxID=1462994 RepID=A0A916IRV8_9BURK|nr:hypothetical protein LMG31506_00001 [Cupriavidus yeoncheonensis]